MDGKHIPFYRTEEVEAPVEKGKTQTADNASPAIKEPGKSESKQST